MAANRSSAVMQQRREPPDALDYFPTPPFATRALCEFLQVELGDLGKLKAWEPAAGEMHMARPLAEHFGSVRSSDVFPYLPELELIDFTVTGSTEPDVDLIATNPPFVLAEEFIATALHKARRGVAMLVRTSFLESEGRHVELFTRTPPTYVLQFVERVVMLKGRLVRKGTPDAANEGKRASSATSYCWLVWLKVDRAEAEGWDCDTRLRWIPVSFDRLERAGDYPEPPIEILPPPADGLFGSFAA